MKLVDDALSAMILEKRVGEALASGDIGQLHAEEERMTSQLPGALLVRLLPADVNTLDEVRTPKMGYADLEMVKDALDSAAKPAAHAAGTEDGHLAIARALPDRRGAALASLSPKLLQDTLATLPAGAMLELRQGSLTLATRGDASLKAAPPKGEVAVPGAEWKVAYWAPPPTSPLAWWILVLPALALILTGLLFFLAARWVSKAMRSDQDNIRRLMDDLIHHRQLENYPLALGDSETLAQAMLQLRAAFRLAAAAGSGDQQPDSRGEAIAAIGDGKPPPTDYVVSTEPAVVKQVPAEIFRAYDIRGIVGQTLTPELAQDLGRAIGSEAHAKGDQRVIVARDGRLSSPELCSALIRGLQATGRTVIDLGVAPTPLLYFATHVMNSKSGVMVTGSHNPANYNGFKIVIGGDSLCGDDVQKLRQRIETQDFIAGIGRVENRDILPEYIERIQDDMQLGRPLKLVIDAGNGVAGKVAPALMRSLGCEVVELYCDVDGAFPNHHPDPGKPENLAVLAKTVIDEEADLGVAFDGDGDRLGLIDAKGKIIWPDRLMMVFAADVLSRQPGADIVYDVKCSRHLASQIVKNGGRPLMWKTGHSLIKAKMKQISAMLGGELSGHIFFKERWFGFDDGIYACARIVEILSGDPRSTDEVFAEYPDSINTPELTISVAEGQGPSLVDKLKSLAKFPEARIIDVDGLRIDFVDGWGLVRASNTTPSLVLRFEADNEAALSRVQGEFRKLLQTAEPQLRLPF
ncbi:MAG: phosphomannomutase/phosphoglucomutase [Methylococcaceae bacterium]|nr:phosphomannomutase/phosphoglucomutase [Methylococcaceae bacterium]